MATLTDKLDSRKQKVAVSANFIHSLDARVLSLVVDEVAKEKENVVVLHDCFIVAPRFVTKIKTIYPLVLRQALLEINAEEFTKMLGGNETTRKEVERLWARAAARAERVKDEDLLVGAIHGLTS